MERKPPQNLSSPLTPQTNSLQYLTRYLQMDLRKVFINKGQVSPELLDKVEKARLKVELCEDCHYIYERFSKIYRQLEKLELELGSTLGLIHGRLSSADATEKLHGLFTGINSNWNGLFEVIDDLRTEAIQKSSNKLPDMPRVRTQHLTLTELQAKQPLAQIDTETLPSQMKNRGLETSGVKMESPNEDGLADNEDRNYFFEDANSNQDNEMNNYTEIENDLNEDNDNFVGTTITRDKKECFPATRNIVGTGKYSIDPETGKRKCKDCSKVFNTSSLMSHQHSHSITKPSTSNSAINVSLAKKLFSSNSSLRLHQRTSQSCSVTESASRFECFLCDKSFPRNITLQEHLDGVHYKLQKYKCDLCGKKIQH